VVLSALEFDVLWEAQRFGRRHVALDVPSEGITHTERARLVGEAWTTLEQRGLASRGRAEPELVDRLALLANPEVSVDGWVWTDREIRALAVASRGEALLGVVDRNEVWLIPARDSSYVPAVVSVAGECPAGGGRSVNLPLDVLREADVEVDGDPEKLITALERRGIVLHEAQLLAGMLGGMTMRGQFGAERTLRDRRVRRADRVVAFHDNEHGRYLYLVRRSGDGHAWVTITPAGNAVLANAIRELVDEL
jgi:hypothetical protein